MHARSARVSRFLETDLKGRVRAALCEYESADRIRIEAELRKTEEQLRAARVAPESSPKVRALQAQLDEATDTAVEADVYDHLYRFFRRYWKDGDFISQRVYKDGAYAIPYQGEEVKLHWANADQYYIKTDEYLRSYSFRLRPDATADPMRVHFRLVDAAEGEHDNVKPAAGKARVFVLASGDVASEEAGESGASELVLRFEYRPATLDDWPEGERAGKKKPPVQKALLDDAASRIASLSVTQPRLRRWVAALERKHVKASGERGDKSRLRAHLERYTARNTFDYFIHKDLGGFLRRELDFYIKNEVMRLDDIENQDAPRAEQYLSRIRAIRRSALPVIDFLASLENLQKRLWLKKKFVVETSYCIRLGCIPDEFLPEIAANEAQRREWVELCGIDAIEDDLATPGYSEPLTVEFLRSQPALMVDTRHFEPEFAARLLHERQDEIEPCGVLVHGENFQALNLVQRRMRQAIACVYTDPPYNTGDSEILYRNGYLLSSWISMMADRVELVAPLLARDAAMFVAIDDFELRDLCALADTALPQCRRELIVVNHHPQGGKATALSTTHEYMVTCLAGECVLRYRAESVERRPFRRSGTAASNFRRNRSNSFYAILVDRSSLSVVGIERPPEEDDESYERGPTLEGHSRVFPIGSDGSERVWRRSYESCSDLIENGKLTVTQNMTVQQVLGPEDRAAAVFSNWIGERHNAGEWGANLLTEIMGRRNLFPYPKSVHSVRDAVGAVSRRTVEMVGTVLDYFAGSGTTGHAVINLNREDGGDRRFILVEMGEHFDTVLLPRLKKVTYSPEWKDGRPVRQATAEEAERSPRIMKVIRLESYEDTLNNLRVPTAEAEAAGKQTSTPPQISVSETSSSRQREHLLRYLLDVDTRHGASLLDVERFIDPTAYTLKVKRPGSDETRETAVDLVETFNWLLGLRVSRLRAPRRVDADFEHDGEGRLKLRNGLREAPDGPWWFRAVEGLLPDDRRALVIWRKRPGSDAADGIEQDNLVLNEWFKAKGWADAPDDDNAGFDVVYANGDHNLQNLRPAGASWTAHLLEEHFFRLMFEEDEQA